MKSLLLNFHDIAMLRGRYPLPHRRGLVPTSDAAVIEPLDSPRSKSILSSKPPDIEGTQPKGEIASVAKRHRPVIKSLAVGSQVFALVFELNKSEL
jgi:hypothetical protein